jgi:DNA (cytosine-5)-methyltransferase 1
MFPATAEVIRQIQPKAFIIENVRGLTRARFAPYFEYIQARLAYPNIRPRPDESWTDHYSRLTRRSRSVDEASHYNVTATLVNAADYGVPQQRWRVFLVGFRSDIDSLWAFPPATHSKELLRIEKQVTGRYWERHGVAPADRPESSVRRPIAEVPSGLKPWRTVRDAIGEMPPPTLDASERYLNHVLQPGARSYPGHTGSPIDEPAKALKAGVHGVPGGENMLRNPDGSIRYFTVREAARLQTFPDRYALHGPWSEAMRQLGNAVPALLAQAVASSVHEHLALNEVRSYLTHDSHLGAESAAPSNEVAA